MRVAWDARPMFTPQLRGIGHYATRLLEALLTRNDRPDVVLFHDGAHPARNAPSGVSVRGIGPRRGYRWQIWERVSLPWHARFASCDLLHSLANTTPPSSALRRVVTVHDVISYLPEFAPPTRLRYHSIVMPHAVRTAEMVVTDSLASKHDIMRVFDVPEERLRVVPLAIDESFRPPAASERAEIRKRLGVPDTYVLALGATARRKNTDGVLRVFKRMITRDEHQRLVLTGVDATLGAMVDGWMSKYAISADKVIRLPFVDDHALSALYADATAFLFLTLYEGFGLPILEAMRCGTPVVCSTRSSCPEVAGDAAALVDPTDEQRAAEIALSVLAERGPCRADRIARGIAHERGFSWDRTAAMTRAIYNEVVGL
jgi:glycosyltransferase involved in cell wall biosynthesis